MWEWAVEFKALLVFVGSHVRVGRRVQGATRVCRVSCGSGSHIVQYLLEFVGSHVGVGRI